jgi:4,5-dihydroxyphthalate decarboxylase
LPPLRHYVWMAPVTVVLGDYPHTRALQAAMAAGGPEGLDCSFIRVTPVFAAFARMVRRLEFGICELALATYLQAREAGIPLTLLPVVMSGDSHHHSLNRWSAAAPLSPRQLAGKHVGVRSYSQTSGMWVRGILREEFGVEAADVTWVTTEPCHVEQYHEPSNVERVDGTVADLLRHGQVAAAILAPVAGDAPAPGLVTVIPDAEAAGREWIGRHGTIPVNHLVVASSDLVREHPDTVSRFYQALRSAIADTSSERPAAPSGRAVAAGWSDSLARCLELAGTYALEQGLLRSRPDIGEIERECAIVASE